MPWKQPHQRETLAIRSNSFSRTPQVVNDWYFFTTSELTKPSRASAKSLDSPDGGAVMTYGFGGDRECTKVAATFTFDGASDAALIGAPARTLVIEVLAVNGARGTREKLHFRSCRARPLVCPGISGTTKLGRQ
ncbi:MAG TPA: hypothetical protein VLK85_30975 [Ramlibacter sp.]|nr:hypothetical protein [Ramlibacter sp.]